MKTAKKLLTLVLSLYCLMTVGIPASASEIQPFAEDVCTGKASLSITAGGQASCTVSVNAKSFSHRIEVDIALCRISDGTPTGIKSWTICGNYSISTTKTYFVAKGYDYQVIATITIKDSNGREIESFPTSSAIVHY